MPVLSGADLIRWRTHPQLTTGGLVVWEPVQVASRRVNQTTFVYSISQLTFDNPDADPGDMANVETGMMIVFRSYADGVVKGTGRVRSVVGSTLHIHPVGRSDVAFYDNDVIDIYDMYQPYALIPYITPDGTLYKDFDVAYNDQTDTFPPVANANPSRLAGPPDSLSGKLRVSFDALGALPSFAMDGSLSSYVWDVKDGSVITGSLTSPALTVDFPPGQRWVKLTVAASNGASSIKRVPIYCGSGNQVILTRRGYGSHASGWELSADVLDDDVSGVLPHALVLGWKTERYGSENSTLGGHTAFVGWVTDELIGLEPLWSDVALNARGPLAILQQRPAFAQTVRNHTSPSAWHQVKGLDWWKTVVYLLMWHSNILELCDLERPVFYADYPLPRLDSQAGSLYDQVRFLADAAWAAFTCDHKGRLFLRRVPHLMSGPERWGHTPIVEVSTADLVGEGQGPRFEVTTWDTLAWLRGGAILAHQTESNAVLAIAPGALPGQGTGVDNVDQRLAVSQVDFNDRLGQEYAYRQRRRWGRRAVQRGTLKIAHQGDVFDPAWLEVLALTLPSATNRRGLSFAADRFEIQTADWTLDHVKGAVQISLGVVQETAGDSADTVLPSGDTVDDMPPPAYEDPVVIDPVPPVTGDGAAIDWSEADGYAATVTEIRRARLFAQAGRTWEVVFTAAADVGAGWVIRDFQCDNLNPRHRAQVVVTNDINETRIYGTTNLDDTTPTWTQLVSFPYRGVKGQLWYSIFPNTVFLMIEPDGARTSHIFHTHDSWTTHTSVLSVGGTNPPTNSHAFFISNHATGQGKGLVIATHGADFSEPHVSVSTNYGGSFSVRPYEFPGYYAPTAVHIPFEGNEDEQVVFVAGLSGTCYVCKSVDQGLTWTNVTPMYNGVAHGGGMRDYRCKNMLVDFTGDSQLMAGMFSPDPAGGGPKQKLFLSDDGGDTWTYRSNLSDLWVYHIGGWPYDSNILYLSCRYGLKVSTSRGQAWQSIGWTGYEDGLVFVPIWK